MPNWSQVSGGLDRVVLVALTWAASKGYITSADVANYATLIVGVLGALYAFYVNRNTNLAKQAASIPNTVVVTTPEIAAATPNSQNILSNSTAKVI
jgi:hypothetical protein